jgi:hypothetical protein
LRVLAAIAAGVALVIMAVLHLAPFQDFGRAAKATPWVVDGLGESYSYYDDICGDEGEDSPRCKQGVMMARIAGPSLAMATLLGLIGTISLAQQSRATGTLAVSLFFLLAFMVLLSLGLDRMFGGILENATGFILGIFAGCCLLAGAILSAVPAPPEPDPPTERGEPKMDPPSEEAPPSTAESIAPPPPAVVAAGPIRRLLCPRCKAVAEVFPNSKPVCWSCGFGG